MRPAEDILSILKRNMDELRGKYHVSSLALFGSYVHGDNTEKSDIDLLVDFETPPGFAFIPHYPREMKGNP